MIDLSMRQPSPSISPEPGGVAVEVTDKKYIVLKHGASGVGFDEEGKSTWPDDQFTHRLIIEGAIKRVGDVENPAVPTAVSGR